MADIKFIVMPQAHMCHHMFHTLGCLKDSLGAGDSVQRVRVLTHVKNWALSRAGL